MFPIHSKNTCLQPWSISLMQNLLGHGTVRREHLQMKRCCILQIDAWKGTPCPAYPELRGLQFTQNLHKAIQVFVLKKMYPSRKMLITLDFILLKLGCVFSIPQISCSKASFACTEYYYRTHAHAEFCILCSEVLLLVLTGDVIYPITLTGQKKKTL